MRNVDSGSSISRIWLPNHAFLLFSEKKCLQRQFMFIITGFCENYSVNEMVKDSARKAAHPIFSLSLNNKTDMKPAGAVIKFLSKKHESNHEFSQI
jgi:hypothetical protein